MSNTIRIEVVLPEGFDKESVSVSVPAILPEKTPPVRKQPVPTRLELLDESHDLLQQVDNLLTLACNSGEHDDTDARIFFTLLSVANVISLLDITLYEEKTRLIDMENYPKEAYKESNPPVADMCGKEPA